MLLGASRHDTTRYLAHAFWHRKTRDVLCRACRAGRRDTHDVARHVVHVVSWRDPKSGIWAYVSTGMSILEVCDSFVK